MISLIKKTVAAAGVLLLCAVSAGILNAQTRGKAGLLILSHGSGSGDANGRVEAMTENIRRINNSKKAFYAIENAFLEVGAPSAKKGIESLQAAGCERIVVIPFFTSQDGHTQADIPAVMGLSSDAETLAELKEEGIELAAPKVPVVITKTLNETNLLSDFAKSEAANLSQKARDEALIIVSLEKNDYIDTVAPSIAKAAEAAARSEGIKNYKEVYSWQDETFWTNAMPAIKEFSKKNKRVLVLSVYTTRSAQSLYENALKAAEAKGIDTKEGFGGAEIIYSQNSLTDYPGTPKILLELAETYLK